MDNGSKPSIYLYPITPYTYHVGANDYIVKKSECLREDFNIVNSQTRLGILDILGKFFKTDIIYFNWIEDLADKSFGYVQVAILFFILIACRSFGKKIVWFVHNNVSHYPKNKWLKKMIRRMMGAFADKIFTHSKQLDLYQKISHITCYEHPIEAHEFVPESNDPEFDILIWGNQSFYKGTDQFLRYNKRSPDLQKLKVLIAGQFSSEEFFKEAIDLAESNITIINRVVEEDELADLFSRSRYVLFCYRKNSVLSSAALSKTLSYGKTVIGPDAGAFKELAIRDLIYTYDSIDELGSKMKQLIADNTYIDKQKISSYIRENDWSSFKQFLIAELKEISQKRSLVLSRTVA